MYLANQVTVRFAFFHHSNGSLFVHQVSKKYVSKEISTEIHQKAAPFIKWLQEAESESEEDDDEEEDLEVRRISQHWI